MSTRREVTGPGAIVERILRLMLLLYPRDFRREYGVEWTDAARDRYTRLRSEGRRLPGIVLLRFLVIDAVQSLPSVRSRRRRGGQSGGRRPSGGRRFALVTGVESLLQDVRFGLRTLRRRPLFTAIAVGTLGLGIGATTAIFSVVEGVLLRPLPYERPGELVQVWETFPDWLDNPQLAAGWDQVYLAWPDYQRWRDNQTLFQGVALYGSTALTLTGQDAPERIPVGKASASLLSVLGVQPILGRAFLPGEDGANAERVALLAYDTWRDRFGSDPDVLGTSITLNGNPFAVVGVLPQGFRVRGLGIFGGSGDPPVWIPIGAAGGRLTVNSHSFDAVARLRPGITVSRAAVETETLLRGDRSPEEIGARLMPRDELEDAGLRGPLYLLLGASLVLMLIACGNVATLLMGEFSGRRHEMATRTAVGAGGGRLVRQLLTESVLLGIAGSVLGVTLAVLGTGALVRLAPPIPRLDQVGVNGAVLLFAASVGAVTGLLFGMAPAWNVVRGKIHDSLSSGGRIRGSRGLPFQLCIISAEIALTVLLLVSGGLLVRSLTTLLDVDPGFNREGVLQVSVRLPTGRYGNSEERVAVFNRMIEEMDALPGVQSVSGTSSLPFAGFPNLLSFGIEGQPEPEGGSRHTSQRSVLPGYFDTMGIPVLAGRTIEDADREGTAAVAVISESMARRFWPGESALGARILFGDTLTVVGIVGDVRHEAMDAEFLPTLYVPNAQDPIRRLSLVVRSAAEPTSLLAPLRQAVWSVDADAPITSMGTLVSLIGRSARAERFRTVLIMVFAVCAALLAGAGVFGVTARSVARQRREMGIRLALGAPGGQLVALALGGTLKSGAVGIAVGLLGALWVSRLFARFLFGVESWDPVTYGAAAAALLGLSILASYLPARRALSVDPVDALRTQ